MRTITEFPFAVEMHDDIAIPMADGVKLAARIWRPVGSEREPVPAILEFLPYRRRDGTAERDALTHPYFAGHGYACVRVDMRGSGDSDGLLEGEYLKQEQDDALDILTWLENQPWCTGKVGMIGISWGGFNGLQVAARRPRQLRAVISICSTDDRYADDIHFMGGALLLDKTSWGSVMFSLNTAPPDPAIVGPRWRHMWMERLKNSTLWPATWLSHQRRDAFWKHGSVCEDYGAIECPVLAVGGWADGYSNAVFRLLAHLKSPRKGLVGPWAHKYPHFAKPGPQIGFLQEALRWWDKWLKGIETGVMEEPMLRAWIEDPMEPAPYCPEKPGRWVAESQWPPADLAHRTLSLAPGQLGAERVDAAVTVSSPQTTGQAAGKWCAYGSWPDQPLDQRQELPGQIVFDSAPLAAAFDSLGAPVIEAEVSCSAANGLLAATLCEVFPDGAATRLTFGILNLTHRDSHENPTALEPGGRYRVRLQLNEMGHRFGAGNRIRLAISNAYWPIVWPSPAANTLTIHCGESRLLLPERKPRSLDGTLKPLPGPEAAPALPHTMLRPAHNGWTASYDVFSNAHVLTRVNDTGLVHLDGIGLSYAVKAEHRFTISPDEPARASLDLRTYREYRREGWHIASETTIRQTATASHFRIVATLDAFENGVRVLSRNWDEEIPRDLV